MVGSKFHTIIESSNLEKAARRYRRRRPEGAMARAGAVVCALLWLSSICSAGQYMFGRAEYALGSSGAGPAALVAGDFNGDGMADVAVVQASRNDVAVFLGQADGTLAPAVFYPAGAQPVALVMGDFNGDGKEDLAVASRNCDSGYSCGADGSVAILLGRGDGTFLPPAVVVSGVLPEAMAAADFNGDGKLDLVVANGPMNSIMVLLGNGDGTFASPVTYPVPGEAAAVVAGDFNSDGRLDLAVGDSGGGVSIFLGSGDGTFSHTGDVVMLGGVNGLAVGDFNHDGVPDLAATYHDWNAVSILLGAGDGTFQPRQDYVTGAYPAGLAVGDFNGDGLADLAVAGGSQVFSILLGNGDGTLLPARDFSLAGTPAAVAAADFNRDGMADVAVVTSDLGMLAVIAGRGDGTFAAPQPYGGSLGSWGIAAGNFAGDGKLDLLTTNLTDNSISVFAGLGNGVFDLSGGSSSGPVPVAAVTGDFNRDGLLDVSIVNQTCTSLPCANGSTSVFLGNGDGTFRPRVDYNVGNIPVSAAMGDFNGDGVPDMAVVNNGFGASNSVSLLLGRGDGTFADGGTLTTGTGPVQAVAADFDGNGAVDLAVAHASGISVLLGRGAGNFGPHTDYPILNGAHALAVGDFNHDGKLDLAATTTNSVAILLGNGDGTFAPGVAYAVSSNIALSSLQVGDFNGDGVPDLLVGKSGNVVSILLGNGDGTFQPEFDVPLGKSERGWTVGDFDGDGGLDIAAASVGTNAVFVALNQPVAGLFPSGLDFGPQGVGTSSAARVVTLSNPSGAPLAVSGMTVNGPFSEASDCPATLAPGAHCALNISFTPGADGNASGVLTIADDALGGTQSVWLRGEGTGEPAAVLSPATLDFGTQNVGTSSAERSVTITNSGGAVLSITSISASGDFAASPVCPDLLAPSAQCTIDLTFSPTASGPRTGVLIILDNATSSPQTVSLSGNGAAAPTVNLSASSLTFGDQRTHTSSAPRTVTLSNGGNAPLAISGINASADFAATHDCPASLAPGASCTISVIFKPEAVGSTVGWVRIADSAPDTPQSVVLTGAGVAPAAALQPLQMSFAAQTVGATSASQPLTLSNPGSAALEVSGFALSGPNAADFAVRNDCGATLAPSASCQLQVSFTPSAAGTRTAALSVATNSGGATPSVPLSGVGADFSIALAAGSSAQLSVTAGQLAVFHLTLLPEGMQTKVSMSCAGAPSKSTCQVSPGTATLDGSGAVDVAVSVQTTAASSALTPPPLPADWSGRGALRQVLLLSLLGMLGMGVRASRKRVWAGSAVLLSALMLAGCGGGGPVGARTVVTTPGTPAGTYTLTVAAVSAEKTHAATLTLIVHE